MLRPSPNHRTQRLPNDDDDDDDDDDVQSHACVVSLMIMLFYFRRIEDYHRCSTEVATDAG